MRFLCVFACERLCVLDRGLNAGQISINGRRRASRSLSGARSGPLWFPLFSYPHQISFAS